MLAAQMGVAPEFNPYQEEAEPPVPMGRRGMKFYRKGGKITGGGGDEDGKKKTKKFAVKRGKDGNLKAY